jgi:DNA helicase-2/ATP-dependent DNA helicase PcrA
MLDVLIGRDQLKKTALLTSPFANYLTSEPPQTPQLYVSLLSHLICLRSAVLSARPTAHGLQDFLEVVDDYRHSQTLLIDDNPLLRGGTDNVQLMSAHSAKGREFEHVIMLSAVDPLWGPKARGGRTSRIPLPENLPLYPAGDTDSDKIRLFYVALTRAKSHLLLTSYEQTETGKPAVPLSYLQLGDQTDWSIAIPQPDPAVSTVQLLETSWRPTVTDQRSLREVLQPALKDFRLSPSALKTFLDLRYSGPQACIERSVLRFPSAYNAHSALGEATHKTLEAAHAAAQANEPIITITQLLEVFDRRLDESGLNEQELHGARQHGHDFLPLFVQQFDFSQLSASETYVTATIGERAIPVGGQIDALIQTNNQLQVLDYKTGQPPLPNWETTGLSDSKKTSYYFYRQQLLFYKLLLDNSAAYGDHAQVTVAELVFAEPTSDGSFIRLRIDVFSDEELARTQALITAVYDCLQRGQVPDTSHYSLDLKGIKAFEDDLLSGTV